MPVVKCPECGERVEVGPGMEGRRVVCPECDERFTVPARRRREDDEDAPRPRKKRRKEAGPNWGVIGGIAAGVLVLAISGVVAYRATRPKPQPAPTAESGEKTPTGDPKPVPGKGTEQVGGGVIPGLPNRPDPIEPALPAGWVRFTTKDGALSAHLPAQPREPEDSVSDIGGFHVKNQKYDYDLTAQGGGYSLDYMILPAGAAPRPEQEAVFLRLPRHQVERLGKGQVTAERSTTLAGAPATEIVFTVPGNITGVYRYGFVRAGGRLLFVMATAAGPNVSPADRQAFLDSIRPAGR